MRAEKSRGLGRRQQKAPGRIGQEIDWRSPSKCSALGPLDIETPREDCRVYFWMVFLERRAFIVTGCRVYIEIRAGDSNTKSWWYEVRGSHRELADLISAVIPTTQMRKLGRQAEREAAQLHQQAHSFSDLATWAQCHKTRPRGKKSISS